MASRNFIIDKPANRITALDVRFYIAAKSGKPYPSVTTVLDAYPKGFWYFEWLKKVGEDADEIRDEAGRKGSVVHSLTEDYDRGAEICLLNDAGDPVCKMSEWAMFERYVEFVTRFKPKIHHIELDYCSELLGFGGTLDRIITLNGTNILLDIKTGNSIYGHFWPQQAAYKKLIEEYYTTNKKSKKIPIDDVGILWLNAKTRTNGAKDAIQGHGWQLLLRGGDIEKDWEVFLATKRLWEVENGDCTPKNFTYSIKHKQ